uniref:Uncharacterized protein n=3 Tax=Oryza TaxID=4527 RepID=A0A0D3EMN4_9ORYZ
MTSPPVVWLLFSSLPLPHFRVLGTRWLQRGMLTCCERSGVLDGDGVGVGTWEDGVRNLSTSWVDTEDLTNFLYGNCKQVLPGTSIVTMKVEAG